MQENLDRIEAHIIRLEGKLDEALKATAANTEAIAWLKGVLKWGGGLLSAAIIGLTTAFFGITPPRGG